MKLILAGCEYSGTTTIANALYDWAERALGANFRIIHDHWKIPHTSGHSPTDEVHFLTEEEYQTLWRESLDYLLNSRDINYRDELQRKLLKLEINHTKRLIRSSP